MFVTEDFTKTVETNDEIDNYLRPPRWMCIHGHDENMKIIFFSDYEANELFPYFKPTTVLLATLLPKFRIDQERLLCFSLSKIQERLMAQLLLFAGSLYFKNDYEQNEFVSFIGYSPSPRENLQQEHFENGLISQNGFVHMKHRKAVLGTDDCKFSIDPNEFIVKLFELRNYGIVPKTAHHLSILRSGRKNVFKVE